jgi:hypothetical protein
MQRPPTTDELNAVYQAVGQGVWRLQYLEDALSKYLTLRIDLKVPGRIAPDAARLALQKRTKGTLGASLKAAREGGLLDAALESRLATFTDERNWLVHRSVDTSAESIYQEYGLVVFLERVLAFRDEAISLQKLFTEFIAEFAASHGIDTELAEQLAREHVSRLRGEA